MFKGKPKIHISAIDFYNGEQQKNEDEKVEFLVETEVEKGEKDEYCKNETKDQEKDKDNEKSKDEMIEFLKKEIDFKNIEITKLQDQLNNSQHLLAMEKQEKSKLLEMRKS